MRALNHSFVSRPASAISVLDRLAEPLGGSEHQAHCVHVFRLHFAGGNLAASDSLQLHEDVNQRERIDQPGRDQRRVLGNRSLAFDHLFAAVRYLLNSHDSLSRWPFPRLRYLSISSTYLFPADSGSIYLADCLG